MLNNVDFCQNICQNAAISLFFPEPPFSIRNHVENQTAIISLFRLKPEFYGEPSNWNLFGERSAKEAVHEIGHTLGLEHCRNSSCIMFFSNSIFDTDQKKLSFCEKCYPSVEKRARKFEGDFWDKINDEIDKNRSKIHQIEKKACA